MRFTRIINRFVFHSNWNACGDLNLTIPFKEEKPRYLNCRFSLRSRGGGVIAMAKNKKGVMDKVGIWAYIVGFALALVLSIVLTMQGFALGELSIAVLAILGFIVGFLNITDSEVETYLIASVAFIIAAWAFMMTIGAWPFLKTFMHAIIVFTAPGALVVSFKALYKVAKD